MLAYSALGTLFTMLMGRRLVRLNYDQLRYEADFRYALVHARQRRIHCLLPGEEQEVQRISSRFLQVLRNYNLLIGWQRNLSFLTTAYRYMPVVLPYLVLFPQYFSGKIRDKLRPILPSRRCMEHYPSLCLRLSKSPTLRLA